jgi:DNA ligase (NAD+)
VCPNRLACSAQQAGAIRHFASRRALDIDGLGPRTIRAILDHGLATSVADLFRLSARDFRRLPRFGPVAASRLAASIDAARHADLDRFLFALGIPGVGPATAACLAAQFGTLTAIRRASEAALAATPGVGQAAGQEVAAFFRQKINRDVIDALVRNGVTVRPYGARRARDGTGPSIVFTGALDALTRAQAERLVEQRGGRVASRVTRATDYVVAGATPGSKLRRANELRIPIISEQEFLQRYRSEGIT